MDLEKMTLEEMEAKLSEVTESLASVKTQLSFARSEAAATGRYKDRDWFQRAQHAERMMGVDHQKLLRAISKRKKDEKLAKHLEHQEQQRSRFKEVARRMLPYDVFMAIVAEAESVQGN